MDLLMPTILQKSDGTDFVLKMKTHSYASCARQKIISKLDCYLNAS